MCFVYFVHVQSQEMLEIISEMLWLLRSWIDSDGEADLFGGGRWGSVCMVGWDGVGWWRWWWGVSPPHLKDRVHSFGITKHYILYVVKVRQCGTLDTHLGEPRLIPSPNPHFILSWIQDRLIVAMCGFITTTNRLRLGHMVDTHTQSLLHVYNIHAIINILRFCILCKLLKYSNMSYLTQRVHHTT